MNEHAAQPMMLIVIMPSITGQRQPMRVAIMGPAILVTMPIAFGGTLRSCLTTLDLVGKMLATTAVVSAGADCRPAHLRAGRRPNPGLQCL